MSLPTLPDGVLHKVFGHLSAKDRASTQQTCQLWLQTLLQEPITDAVNMREPEPGVESSYAVKYLLRHGGQLLRARTDSAFIQRLLLHLCRGLKRLELFGDSITDQLLVEPGNAVWGLRELKLTDSLRVSCLPELPYVQLTRLEINNCGLTEPESTGIWQRLEHLAVVDCTHLTDWLFDWEGVFPCLVSLSFKGCVQLQRLPEAIGCLTTLETLCLSGCSEMDELPPDIGDLGWLRALDLNDCASLAELPPEVGGLTSLLTLDLERCTSIVRLPEEIGLMVSLKALNTRGCSTLITLPAGIGGLVSLRVLNLTDCVGLRWMPPEVSGLTGLRDLHMFGCVALEEFPQEFGTLTNLAQELT